MPDQPKVLVGCPTYKGKEYCLKEYLQAAQNLSYPNYDLVLVDNSEDDAYFKTLQQNKVTVIKEPGIGTPIQRVVNSRNRLRDLALEQDYGYFLSLEQDVIPPKDVIERLLQHSKSVCGGVYFTAYHMGQQLKIRPLMWAEASNERMRFMKEESKGEELHKVRATGLGCLLIHRSVLQSIRFRWEKDKDIYDDILFCNDAKEKGYDVFVDAGAKCTHIIELDGKYVALGLKDGSMRTDVLR